MVNRSPDGHPGPAAVSGLDRRILHLAVPALGALVAEPIFVLVDSAVVGRLGTVPLAGLALASTVLTTVVGLCVFLAYATTAAVARLMGAGDRDRALRSGVDGMWLAAGLGVLLAVALEVAAPTVVRALGAPTEVVPHAVAYLRWSAPGLPGMLVVLAATGALRGMLDTRTPLVVAASGAVLNALLSVGLVLGLGFGVAGSGAGTALTQLAMAVVLVARVARGARAAGIPVRPRRSGILDGLVAGAPLLVRTVSLRVAILLTAWVAAGLGTVTLAGHQAVAALWGLAAFALDALAIAAQALVGHALGAADPDGARAVVGRVLRWGTASGAVLGIVLAASAPWTARLFTEDPAVHAAVTAALLVVAVTLPMAGWVFVLDGVLIGAGDGRYLAVVGMVTLAVYAPAAFAVQAWAPGGRGGLVWLWIAFGGLFMAARAVTTGLRVRGAAWLALRT